MTTTETTRIDRRMDPRCRYCAADTGSAVSLDACGVHIVQKEGRLGADTQVYAICCKCIGKLGETQVEEILDDSGKMPQFSYYNRNGILAIFAAVGNEVVDTADRVNRVATHSSSPEECEVIADVLDLVQEAIFKVIKELANGTDPETI